MKPLLLIIFPFITSIAICQPYIAISSGSQTDCIGDLISLQAKNGALLHSREAPLFLPQKRYGQVYETTTERTKADKRATDNRN